MQNEIIVAQKHLGCSPDFFETLRSGTTPHPKKPKQPTVPRKVAVFCGCSYASEGESGEGFRRLQINKPLICRDQTTISVFVVFYLA